jgi:hypothetical protein
MLAFSKHVHLFYDVLNIGSERAEHQCEGPVGCLHSAPFFLWNSAITSSAQLMHQHSEFLFGNTESTKHNEESGEK